MATSLRIATFNVENLDDRPTQRPSLAERIAVMRSQMVRLRADVICLQEIHGQERPNQPRDLLALRALLQHTPYATYEVAHTKTGSNEAYDVRNLVVLSRFPIKQVEQVRPGVETPKPSYRMITADPPEIEPKDIGWERPILYVTLDLGANGALHVVNLHLKSKIPTPVPGQTRGRRGSEWLSAGAWAEGYFVSSMKRMAQAVQTRLLLDRIFTTHGDDAMIAVGGDFNAESDSVPMLAILGRVEETGNAELIARVLIPCENTVPESSRYTLLHLGKGAMLDHIVVSRALVPHYRSTEIHNETLPDESGAFRTDVQFPESDHAPVVAEFVLP